MTSNSTTDERIDFKLANGQFLETLYLIQNTASTVQHKEFIDKLKVTANLLKDIFAENELIRTVSSTGKDFWAKTRGKRIAFVDGGVASLDIPSSAPVGIRVGTYSVKTGDSGPDREQFDFKTTIVDELFGDNSRTFIDNFDDIRKLVDGSRIIAEVSAAYKLVREEDYPPDLVMLHGPLINPVAPYGTPGFPAFTQAMAEELFPFLKSPDDFKAEDDRNFVNLYLKMLNSFNSEVCPCIGVIERSATKRPQVVRAHLKRLREQGKITKENINKLEETFDAYFMTDPMILSIILNEGDWIEPISLNPQEPESKWPDKWKSQIRSYPNAVTTFVKSSEHSDPFKVQISEEQKFESWIGDLIVNTARLLPTYSFPVGLDIVDKFAKVPAWMSKGIRGQHATTLVMKALETGNQETINYAKRILAAKGRDWMFRPKA